MSGLQSFVTKLSHCASLKQIRPSNPGYAHFGSCPKFLIIRVATFAASSEQFSRTYTHCLLAQSRHHIGQQNRAQSTSLSASKSY